MAKYKYVGKDTRLGRFGFVRKGDVLDLTTREEEHISDDDRFEKHDPKDKEKPAPGIVLPPNFDKLPKPEQEALRKKLEADEKARVALLAEQNKKTQIEQIDQMSKTDLLEMAAKMKKEGKPIDFNDEMEPKQLRKAIKQIMFGAKDEE